jgi:two-component system cell cycle sensor histidine kinase/response regulator CckA
MPQQAKFAASQARKLCRSLLDGVNDAVIIFDPRTLRVVDANQSATKIYGYPKEELIGKALKELTSEVRDYSRLPAHGQSIERTDFGKAGNEINFLVSLSAINYLGRKAVLSINRDISERKRIEEVVASNEKKLRLLLLSISEIIVLVDVEGKIRFISPQVVQVLGLSVSELTGRSVFDFVHPDDRQRVLMEYTKIVQEPGQGMPTVARFRNQEGYWVPFEILANNQLLDPDIHGVIFTGRDLRFRREMKQAMLQTDETFDRHVEQRTMELAKANAALRIENQQRRYAEAQLRHSLSLLHSTLESTADGIMVVANDGQVTSCNQKFMEMWNIPRMAISGLRETHLIASAAPQVEDPQAFMDRLKTLSTTPDTVSIDSIEMKDGRILERYSQPQRVDGIIVGRVWSFRDVTHSRLLEEDLRQSQKMEAIGRLAGSVAHDFNNFLMLISGYASQLLDDTSLRQSHRTCCEQMISATRRAAALTRQLLAFSRKNPASPQVLDLNSVLSSISNMLQRLLSDQIQLALNLWPKMLPIFADPSQIELMIMNLAINARDAMPSGGILSITTSSETSPAPDLSGPEPAQYVVLEVRDTGLGMSPEVKKHIFEPFFTTKSVGEGTGLGLSTVYGIAEQANGYVTVESETGQGSTFRIYLPQAMAAVPEKSVQTAPSPLTGHETLLLAEDESGIRIMTRAYLESLGYKVLDAENGKEALGISREYKDTIDLLITDILMPEMRGDDLLHALKKERPGITALFISGYMDFGDRAGSTPIVEKPFTFPELSRHVRNVLDQREQAAGVTSPGVTSQRQFG